MSAAKIVCLYVRAFCAENFTNPETMESTVMNGGMADVFDHVGHGTHKYIPAEKLSDDLKLQKGAGVFGYWKMYDGSYVLWTCPGPLAYWSGKDEDPAEWPPERRRDRL